MMLGHHENRCIMVAERDTQIGANYFCQINLVDYQQVRLGNPQSPLRGILSPPDTSITYMV